MARFTSPRCVYLQLLALRSLRGSRVPCAEGRSRCAARTAGQGRAGRWHLCKEGQRGARMALSRGMSRPAAATVAALLLAAASTVAAARPGSNTPVHKYDW